MCQVGHSADAGVVPEAKRQIVVAPGLEQRKRALQLLLGLDELSGEPMGDSSDAMRDAGLGRIGRRCNVVEEGLGVRPHRRQFASHVAADPQAVIDRQSFGGVFVAIGPIARPRERFCCLWRPIAARRDERVAVGDLQLSQPLPLRGLAP